MCMARVYSLFIQLLPLCFLPALLLSLQQSSLNPCPGLAVSLSFKKKNNNCLFKEADKMLPHMSCPLCVRLHIFCLFKCVHMLISTVSLHGLQVINASCAAFVGRDKRV